MQRRDLVADPGTFTIRPDDAGRSLCFVSSIEDSSSELKINDAIFSVNGAPAGAMGVDALSLLFEDLSGSEASLVVGRLAEEEPLVEQQRFSPRPPAQPRAPPPQGPPAPKPGFKYDVLYKEGPALKYHKIGRKPKPGQEFPSPPKSGWYWRSIDVLEVLESPVDKYKLKVSFIKPKAWSSRDVQVGESKILTFDAPSDSGLAPYGVKTPERLMHHKFIVNEKVEALDQFKSKKTGKIKEKWRSAVVVATTPYFVRVSFDNWKPYFDVWIHALQEPHRLKSLSSPEKHETEEEFYARQEALESEFKAILKAKRNLEVIEVAPDGNCMFRAAAMQIFGSADEHDEIRQSACDYMWDNRERFEQLVPQGEFDAYVEDMRYEGEWGDDPELRAIEECFDRPVEILASLSDPSLPQDRDPSEPIRFHFDGDLPSNLKAIPLVFSYHGKNHYNCVLPVGWTEDDIPKEPKKLKIRAHRIKNFGGESSQPKKKWGATLRRKHKAGKR